MDVLTNRFRRRSVYYHFSKGKFINKFLGCNLILLYLLNKTNKIKHYRIREETHIVNNLSIDLINEYYDFLKMHHPDYTPQWKQKEFLSIDNIRKMSKD